MAFVADPGLPTSGQIRLYRLELSESPAEVMDRRKTGTGGPILRRGTGLLLFSPHWSAAGRRQAHGTIGLPFTTEPMLAWRVTEFPPGLRCIGCSFSLWVNTERLSRFRPEASCTFQKAPANSRVHGVCPTLLQDL